MLDRQAALMGMGSYCCLSRPGLSERDGDVDDWVKMDSKSAVMYICKSDGRRTTEVRHIHQLITWEVAKKNIRDMYLLSFASRIIYELFGSQGTHAVLASIC